jgi:hypothetical protein
MTLDEIAASIPNGFHDAELNSLTIDYAKREARLILDIWVADDQENPEELESYRPAEVTLSGLVFWVSEPPDPRYPYGKPGAQRIDIGPLATLERKETLHLPPVPPGAFANWVFVTDWNAFVYVAAEGARLKWLGSRTVRPR